jgi:zinc protease
MFLRIFPKITGFLYIFSLMFFTEPVTYAIQKIEFEEFDLDNGLHIIMHRDTSNPLVNVDIWYHVGSKNEDSNHTGFAHLFEHMMFQGSKNVGKAEHFTYIQKAGGMLNGSTNQDRTNYFETVPSNQLELVLWLESDRMNFLNVTQENFDNQRSVVKEEKRQRYDNIPYGSRFQNMFSSEYVGHPYHWTTIGSMEDLDNASLNYAQDFYKSYYAPNNAVLVISGDINYNETKQLVKKYFSSLTPAPPKNTNYPGNVFHQGEKRDTIYDNIRLPAIYIAYKIPSIKSKDIYALSLLSTILGESKSSRLYKKLVYEKKAARTVRTMIWGLELGGLMIFSSTGLKKSSLKNIEELIDAEIDKVKEQAVSENEIEKAKNSEESHFVNRIETMRGISDMLAYYRTYFKNTNMINTEIDNYRRVTDEDIIAAARKYLTKDNRVVLYYMPKNGETPPDKNPEMIEEQ